MILLYQVLDSHSNQIQCLLKQVLGMMAIALLLYLMISPKNFQSEIATYMMSQWSLWKFNLK